MRRKFIQDISSNSFQVIINQACGLAIFYLVIAPVLIPRFTKIFNNKEKNESKKINDLFVLLKFEIIIASLVALLLNVLWVPVIDFIINGKYGLVNRYTILSLSASMPFIYINNFLWTINFSGKLKMIFHVFFITFLVNLVGNIFLIHYFSATGAAVAYLVAIAAQSVLFWIKTSLPKLKKNILPFLLCPFIAITAGSVSVTAFNNIILIFLLSIFIFFILLVFTKVLRKNDWLVFRKITGF